MRLSGLPVSSNATEFGINRVKTVRKRKKQKRSRGLKKNFKNRYKTIKARRRRKQIGVPVVPKKVLVVFKKVLVVFRRFGEVLVVFGSGGSQTL